VPPPDDPTRAPRSGLILMLIIVIAVALVAFCANVQKARRDKIEKVTVVPISESPTASPSPNE